MRQAPSASSARDPARTTCAPRRPPSFVPPIDDTPTPGRSLMGRCRRFPIRRSRWALPVPRAARRGRHLRSRSATERVSVRMGLLGSADIPVALIAAVGTMDWPWWGGVGARIARGLVAFVGGAGDAGAAGADGAGAACARRSAWTGPADRRRGRGRQGPHRRGRRGRAPARPRRSLGRHRRAAASRRSRCRRGRRTGASCAPPMSSIGPRWTPCSARRGRARRCRRRAGSPSRRPGGGASRARPRGPGSPGPRAARSSRCPRAAAPRDRGCRRRSRRPGPWCTPGRRPRRRRRRGSCSEPTARR